MGKKPLPSGGSGTGGHPARLCRTGSSLFAVGYAYSEMHREYSALLQFRFRQTDLSPRQECQ